MAASLLIAASTPNAAAGVANGGTKLSGPNVVRYAAPGDGPTIVIQGIRLGDGCLFRLAGTTATSDPHSRYEEAAFDPTTCESEIRVVQADYRDTSAGASDSDGGGVNGGNSAPVLAGAALSTSTALCSNPNADKTHYYADSACIHSWFSDPANFHVNDLTNEVQWNPSGGCANSGAAYASWYAQWLSATGWYLVSNQFSPSFSCSGVTSLSYTKFWNGSFCGPSLPTDTWYWPQTITGLANGSYTWSTQWYKDGVCSILLSFGYQPG